MPEIIAVDNLVKRYRDVTAVDGISFAVNRGECFGLLGPNGAGKTTTIKMLYGFSPVTSGTLRVFSADISRDWRTIKSRIGVCQQENTLDPDLTVYQNLIIFAGYFNISGRQARIQAGELIDFFALGHKKEARVSELSGGMVRRLMIARALINDPDLLVLDEPTTGLDPQSRHQVWERLESLKERGLTILLTTHYMEEAERLCDRLVIVDHGKILVEGSPASLIAEYAGSHVIEVDGADDVLRQFVADNRLAHDDLGTRIIIYADAKDDVSETIRKSHCSKACIDRNSSLEDVFLRLTGRGLRE